MEAETDALAPQTQPEPQAKAEQQQAEQQKEPEQLQAAQRPHAAPLAWGWRHQLLLSWLWPIVRYGYSTPLQHEDLPPLPAKLRPAAARSTATAWWSAELAAGRTPTIFRMLWHTNRREVVLGLINSAIYGLTNVVVRPVLLKLTIESVGRRSGEEAGDSLYGLMLVLVIGCTMLVEGIVGASSRHYLSDQLSTAMFGKTSSLIQAKSLRLEGSTTPETQPSTLIGSDLVRGYEYSKQLALAPMSVSGIIGGFVLLVVTCGWGGVIGIVVLCSITVRALLSSG